MDRNASDVLFPPSSLFQSRKRSMESKAAFNIGFASSPNSPSKRRTHTNYHTMTKSKMMFAALSLILSLAAIASPKGVAGDNIAVHEKGNDVGNVNQVGSDENDDGFTKNSNSGGDDRDNGKGNVGNGNSPNQKVFRVFQTLPKEPSEMDAEELNRIVRATQAMVFHDIGNNAVNGKNAQDPAWEGISIALDIYTPSERREYLVKRGNKCHPSNSGSIGMGGVSNSGGGGGVGGVDGVGMSGDNDGNTNMDEEDSSLAWYDILARYDSLLSHSSSKSSKSSTSQGSFSKSNSPNSNGSLGSAKSFSSSSAQELERMATELWKFCVLFNGDGHLYLDYEEGMLLKPLKEILSPDENFGVVANESTYSSAGVLLAVGGEDEQQLGRYIHESFISISPYTPAKSELGAMIRLFLETSNDMLALSPLLLPRELHRLIVGRNKGDNNANTASENNDGNNDGVKWTLLKNSCIDLADPASSSRTIANDVEDPSSSAALNSPYASFFAYPSSSSTLSGLGTSTPDAYARRTAARCPLAEGGFCCSAFFAKKDTDGNVKVKQAMPVLALRHPVGGWSMSATSRGSSTGGSELPYKLNPVNGGGTKSDASQSEYGGVPESDLPYISTVRLIQNNTKSAPTSTRSSSFSSSGSFASHPLDTPNFFDILFENDCLPYRKECHRCLKDVTNEATGDEEITITTTFVTTSSSSPLQKHEMQNACSKCKLECPCYCDILCKVRPPPKKVVRTYAVHPPRYKKVAERLVPKIVHQTWFEPVTQEKYPNMSRLIESWKKSGWEYYFYDDDTAGEFLSTHFPPEIRDAYDSITPGAFKADLFRYCVLLIRGGVYADMDVLLETNLDDAVANDIGFMTPIDEPGIDVGHRSCLWNGLIASAPGHPFLARTIEIVVNNIRNRFTAVDYDDMLCPNPILSVSHTVDTLFTCGPCILGAGINNLLGRHMQNEFEIGDVDIWLKERLEMKKKNPSLGGDNSVAVSPDDPRLLIPGRTVILEQNKNDMGAHRFTWADRHLIIAATDMPDYDDRPPTKEHYSKTHEKAGIYGMRKLYTNNKRANEEIRIVVEKL